MYKLLVKILMVKYIDLTNNYLLKLIKKQRHKNVPMYIVRVSLAKSEQVFICCYQLNSLKGTDLSWVLKVGSKSFYPEWFWYFLFPFIIFKVLSNDFKVLLSHIIMVFLNAVFEHVPLVISSIVVFQVWT